MTAYDRLKVWDTLLFPQGLFVPCSRTGPDNIHDAGLGHGASITSMRRPAYCLSVDEDLPMLEVFIVAVVPCLVV